MIHPPAPWARMRLNRRGVCRHYYEPEKPPEVSFHIVKISLKSYIEWVVFSTKACPTMNGNGNGHF